MRISQFTFCAFKIEIWTIKQYTRPRGSDLRVIDQPKRTENGTTDTVRRRGAKRAEKRPEKDARA